MNEINSSSKFLIVGAGGRECAFARRLFSEVTLYAVLPHANPMMIDYIAQSGGQYAIDNPSDPDTVLAFAREHAIDYAFINSDEPLANGVVDRLLENDIKTIGGTRAATRIEWDKIYAIEMLRDVCPEFTPRFRVVGDASELSAALKYFESERLPIVVKPQGLTGGKGVKVMPIHLATYQDCAQYAATLLEERPREKVLLVEKLDGIEFTIMGLTDGDSLTLAPATYDYPYRYADDAGAGTGGMGCFTGPAQTLPFLDDDDLRDCRAVMQAVVDELKARRLAFNGVLNGGFFKTSRGIQFMEFNARFGDPESLNVLAVLESSFAQLLVALWHKTLSQHAVEFRAAASVVKYLVAAEYPEASAQSTAFTVDEDCAAKCGVDLFFASCVKNGDAYETLKKSRVLAVSATAETIAQASDIVNQAIERCVQGELEYRSDIGSSASLDKLRDLKR